MPLPSAINATAPSAHSASAEHLIAASGVRPDDRVLVFGYHVLDHLVGLARHGVDCALGIHAGSRYCPREAVDVVWFTAVGDIDSEVIGALRGIGCPRLVAVELVPPSEFGSLRRLIVRLRGIGLANTSYYKANGRFILTAWRPSSRRTVSAAGSVIPLRRTAQ